MTSPSSSADANAPCRRRDDDSDPVVGSTAGGGDGEPAGNSPPRGRRRSNAEDAADEARRGPAPWGRSPGETRWTLGKGKRRGTGEASRSPAE